MDINEMSRSDFMELPSREWDEDIGKFDSLIIIPAEIKWYHILKYDIINWIKGKISWFDSYYIPDGLHNSDYRCMDFVACKGTKPICLLSGCSDVIHLNGISGAGKDWLQRYGSIPEMVPRVGISIDCLKKSGFLRMFVSEAQFEAGPALSSFELFIDPIKENV